jgi:hypothetical protein
MNRFQEVDENATDGIGTDKLGQADRRPASIESLRPVTAATALVMRRARGRADSSDRGPLPLEMHRVRAQEMNTNVGAAGR